MKIDVMQSVFDTAWEAVIAQGKPSINDDGECMYRGLGGLKCAIGHLIPDDEYKPCMEYQIPHNAPLTNTVPDDNIDIRNFCFKHGYNNLYFMMGLQGCHDEAGLNYPDGGSDFIRIFKKEMRRFAKRYNLKVPGK